MKLFNWNVKLWAFVFALIIVLAGAGVLLSDNDVSKDTAVVISRVNTEGSGIFGDDPEMVTIENGIAVFHKEHWEGKTIATPGETSIQYKMIKEELIKIGLEPKAYDNTIPCPDNSIYLKTTGVALMKEEYNTGIIDGGIAWEPIYSDVLLHADKKVYNLCESNQLEGYDGHACCMIVGNSEFLDNNTEETVRFLAGYIKGVDFINHCKEHKDSDDYEELIQISSNLLGGQYGEDVIEEALDNVNFTYDLTNFQEEYVSLLNSFMEGGAIPKDAMSILDETPEEFAEDHIDSSYLEAAKKMEQAESYRKATLTVSYLGGDIHQLALQVAQDKGYFDEYGIEIKLQGPHSAGGAVLTAVLSGEADLGFAGAPPVVMMTTNTAIS